jgi:hypothetical protein
MYGIWYTHSNFWGTSSNKPGGWWQYIAADWDIRVILEASHWRVWAASDMRAPRFYDTNNMSYYLDPNWNSYLYRTYINDLRTSIFYDKDNTWYYVNPNWTSNLNTLRTQWNITIDRDLYLWENWAGTTDQYFYDDNSNTWRGLRWNNWANRFEIEDNNWNYHQITTEDIDTDTVLAQSTVETYIANDVSTNYIPKDNWNKFTNSSIYDNGNVWIWTSNPSYKLDVNGTIRASSFLYSSDKRLKKDIKTIDSALEKILKLRWVEFNWKKDSKKDIWLIAQEVEKVFPNLVKTDVNWYKSVKYANLVSPIIEAIKELSNKVNIILKQQEKINTLENKVNNLEKRLEKLEKMVK